MSPPSFVAMILLSPHHLPSTRTDIIREAPILDSKNCVKAPIEREKSDAGIGSIPAIAPTRSLSELENGELGF